MEGRYERNFPALSHEEGLRLGKSRVCVAGCGGLGGGVIEGLVRMGAGKVKAVDGDVFDETNLNRQVLSHEENLGRWKASEAALQMKKVNSLVEVIPVKGFIDRENAEEIIKGADLAVDALDNIRGRKVLEAACERLGIPLIHGAIAGWMGQVSVIMPGDRIIERLYQGEEDRGDEVHTGTPYFTPALVSAIETAEAVKLLTGRESPLRSRLLTVDLLTWEYEITDFGGEK